MSPVTGWHGMIFQLTWVFINTTVRKMILHVIWYVFTNLINPIQDLKFLYTDLASGLLTWRLFLHLECLLYCTVHRTAIITNDLQVRWSYGFTLLLFTSISLIQFTEACFVSICLRDARFCFSRRRLWCYKFVPTWTFVVFLQQNKTHSSREQITFQKSHPIWVNTSKHFGYQMHKNKVLKFC